MLRTHVQLYVHSSLLIVAGMICLSWILIGAPAQRAHAQPAAAGSRGQYRVGGSTLVYLPSIFASPSQVKFTAIVYAGRGNEALEHIHFCNSSDTAISIAGWRIVSESTGNAYTFGAGVSVPPNSCANEDDELTLNTSFASNADGVKIFNWGRPVGFSEWPNDQGTALFYDTNNRLVSRCDYVAEPATDGGESACGAR
ncbi:MAG: lamin tail domain-containing protein [Roseiflexaceae bacterium]